MSCLCFHFIRAIEQGGVQVYFAMLTKRDLPPFGPDEVIVDEWFIELKRQAGGGECSPEDVVGAKGNVNVSLSVVVDCFIGYSGDDCNCSSGDTNCGNDYNTAFIVCIYTRG